MVRLIALYMAIILMLFGCLDSGNRNEIVVDVNIKKIIESGKKFYEISYFPYFVENNIEAKFKNEKAEVFVNESENVRGEYFQDMIKIRLEENVYSDVIKGIKDVTFCVMPTSFCARTLSLRNLIENKINGIRFEKGNKKFQTIFYLKLPEQCKICFSRTINNGKETITQNNIFFTNSSGEIKFIDPIYYEDSTIINNNIYNNYQIYFESLKNVNKKNSIIGNYSKYNLNGEEKIYNSLYFDGNEYKEAGSKVERDLYTIGDKKIFLNIFHKDNGFITKCRDEMAMFVLDEDNTRYEKLEDSIGINVEVKNNNNFLIEVFGKSTVPIFLPIKYNAPDIVNVVLEKSSKEIAIPDNLQDYLSRQQSLQYLLVTKDDITQTYTFSIEKYSKENYYTIYSNNGLLFELLDYQNFIKQLNGIDTNIIEKVLKNNAKLIILDRNGIISYSEPKI